MFEDCTTYLCAWINPYWCSVSFYKRCFANSWHCCCTVYCKAHACVVDLKVSAKNEENGWWKQHPDPTKFSTASSCSRRSEPCCRRTDRIKYIVLYYVCYWRIKGITPQENTTRVSKHNPVLHLPTCKSIYNCQIIPNAFVLYVEYNPSLVSKLQTL